MKRMIDPQMIIKSRKIADDKEVVDLIEVLEKYGSKAWDDEIKTITIQIYNKVAVDDGSIDVSINGIALGSIVYNSVITVTKFDDDTVYIQGNLYEYPSTPIRFIEIPSEEYDDDEKVIKLDSPYEFDLHVIKV